MRLVYICDWLPPEFGAVGQYAMLEAREWAARGFAVTLVGLTSGVGSREMPARIGKGSVEIIRVHRPAYQKQRFVERLLWTIASNLALLRARIGSRWVETHVLERSWHVVTLDYDRDEVGRLAADFLARVEKNDPGPASRVGTEPSA